VGQEVQRKEKFYRPWFSQKKSPKGDHWALLDQRGGICDTKKGKWPGVPLASNLTPHKWKGYELKDFFDYIKYKKENLRRSQKVICVYVYDPKLDCDNSFIFNPYRRIHIVFEVVVKKDATTSSVTCTGFGGYRKEIKLDFEDVGLAHSTQLFTEIELLKELLDKPEYENYKFYHKTGNCWEYK
jgi:hypothetical protein